MEFPELLDTLRDKIKWKVSLTEDDKEIFTQEKKGYFRSLSIEECKMLVRDHFKNATPSTVNNLTVALIQDTKRLFDKDLFIDSKRDTIGFLNNTFDLTTGKVRRYRTTDFICDPLPFDIPREVNPDLEQWFYNVIKDWVGIETAAWFIMLLAYMLFIYPNREHVWLNFFGSGSNGKSVCLELLEEILGRGKCIGCDLRNLNRFSGSTVSGKWLVVGRDSSAMVSDSATSFIKSLSGDDTILVEHKGGSSYDEVNVSKLIVSTNSLIQSKDRSFAWYRRLFPIHFANRFPRSESFKRDLFKQIPGITRVLLKNAYMYGKNGTSLFSCVPEPVSELRKETRIMNDRVTGFWEEYFHVDKELSWYKMKYVDGMSMTQVYTEFSDWHTREFGESRVEPSMKSFGGAYGAFLSTEAGKYFEYQKHSHGRIVRLRSEYTDYIRDLDDESEGGDLL